MKGGEKEDLQPCPFCGGSPDVTKHFKHEMYGLVHRCPVIPSVVMPFAEKGYNEAKWNTRINSHASLLSHNKTLREALQIYGEHRHNCLVGHYNPGTGGPHECNCGFDEALAQSKEPV